MQITFINVTISFFTLKLLGIETGMLNVDIAVT